MKIHESLTEDVIIEAVEATMFGTANIGFCIHCGCEADGCEPDMEKGFCAGCERREVYGAEQLMFMTVA